MRGSRLWRGALQGRKKQTGLEKVGLGQEETSVSKGFEKKDYGKRRKISTAATTKATASETERQGDTHLPLGGFHLSDAAATASDHFSEMPSPRGPEATAQMGQRRLRGRRLGPRPGRKRLMVCFLG